MPNLQELKKMAEEARDYGRQHFRAGNEAWDLAKRIEAKVKRMEEAAEAKAAGLTVPGLRAKKAAETKAWRDARIAQWESYCAEREVAQRVAEAFLAAARQAAESAVQAQSEVQQQIDADRALAEATPPGLASPFAPAQAA